MDMRDWQDSLVEWVNICGHVDHLIIEVTELGNGKFFEPFLGLLKSIHGSAPLKDDMTLEEIFQELSAFVKNEYPEYGFDSNICRDETELTYITSLLLLHCCLRCNIHDIISKMCVKLSRDTLYRVKIFLESFVSNRCVTRKMLQEAISGKEGKDKTPGSFMCCAISPKSNTSLCSPIQRRRLRSSLRPSPFKCPAERQLFDKQAQEIRRLKSQVDVQTCDHIDLQEKLHSCKERSKTLENNCNRMVEEIKHFNQEIVAIDHFPNMTDEKPSSFLNEKRHKEEIKSLESYITSLQNDICGLEDCKENLARKLTTSERQCSLWQEKAQHYELLCDEFQHKLEEKGQELQSLTEQCNELYMHVQSQKSFHNISIESDSSDIAGNLMTDKNREDLGSTVIDLQLRETVEEKKLLLNEVERLTEESEKLSVQCNNLQLKLNKSLADYETVFKCSKEREENCTKMYERIQCENQENKRLTDDILILQTKIEELTEQKEVIISEKCVLQEKYSYLKSKFIERQKEWQQEKERLKKTNQVELDKQIDNIQARYEDKLRRLKVQMKTVCIEEINKIKQQYAGSTKLEEVCKDYAEKDKKSQADITELRSQVWNLGEKLLKEQEEKTSLKQQYEKLHMKYTQASANDSRISVDSFEKQKKPEPRNLQDQTDTSYPVMDVIEETVTSVRSVPMSVPLVHAFPQEDEVFNTTHLADMKAGRCSVQKDRISELQYRNFLCPPHLKSSYPAEYDKNL